MKRSWLKLPILALSALVVACSPDLSSEDTSTNPSNWPKSVKLGTASQGGTYFIYGSGWGNLVQEKLGVNVSVEATGGPMQNMALMQVGELELGMTTLGPAYDSWLGNNPVAPGVETKNVRALFPMYQTPFQIIALESAQVRSFSDLANQKVGVGPQGGTAATFYPRFAEELGIEMTLQYGGGSDLGNQLQDGLIDVFAYAAGAPIPAFSEVLAQKEAVIFGFSPSEINTLAASNPALTQFTVSAGSYAGQSEDISTLAMWNFAIAHKDIPEQMAYDIVKVVLESNEELKTVHGAAAETLAENMVNNSFLWFHPGAIRYFKEQGLDVPNALIPPEYQE